MELLIASNNKHKVEEIRAILSPYFSSILTLNDAGIDVDVVEDGETFEENAAIKAHAILALAKADAVLADDSGLMVDALCGAPGVYSARFAGEGHDNAANNKKLIEVMRDVPPARRACRFVTAVCLSRRAQPDVCARGEAEGELLSSPQGDNGFGYDPLFYYAPLNKTFAQLTPEEKNAVSHRKRALTALCEKLEAQQRRP